MLEVLCNFYINSIKLENQRFKIVRCDSIFFSWFLNTYAPIFKKNQSQLNEFLNESQLNESIFKVAFLRRNDESRVVFII